MRPHVVHWLDALLPAGIASAIAPSWFTCVGLAGLVALGWMLAIARRHRLDPGAVASVVLWCYVAAVAAGIAVPLLVDAAIRLTTTGRIHLRWAGMTSFWGYLGGLVAVIAACRVHRLPLARVGDLAAAPLGIALVLARLGCFLGGCDFGKVTSVPWAVRFPSGSPAWRAHVGAGLVPGDRAASLAVHPTQLYEAALGVVIAVVAVTCVGTRRHRDGRGFLLCAAIYALGRLFIEDLRGDAGRGIYLGLSSGQIFSLVVLAVLAVIAGSWRIRRPRGPAVATAALALTATLVEPTTGDAQPGSRGASTRQPFGPLSPESSMQPRFGPPAPPAQPPLGPSRGHSLQPPFGPLSSGYSTQPPFGPPVPAQQPFGPPAPATSGQPASPTPDDPYTDLTEPDDSAPPTPEAPPPSAPPPDAAPAPLPFPPAADPRPRLHAGLLVGIASPLNRRRDQVAMLGGPSISLGLALDRVGLWLDLDSHGNTDATHGTLLVSASTATTIAPRFQLGGRIGLGATLVNFDEPAFRDVAGTTLRIEAIAAYDLTAAWALWLRPLTLDMLTADALGGPIVTWQARIGIAYQFAAGSGRASRSAAPSDPTPYPAPAYPSPAPYQPAPYPAPAPYPSPAPYPPPAHRRTSSPAAHSPLAPRRS